MEGKLAMAWVLILCVATVPVHSEYYSDSVPRAPAKEKKTHLHFFLHDTISGNKPSSVMVAHANLSSQGDDQKNPTPFGSVFVFDDPLTEGSEPTSRVIGNARGVYVSSSENKDLTLTVYADYGFTTGKFNGSSISVFSRLPLTMAEPTHELAVVGGRKRFRMARGFAELKPHYFNATNGDAVTEYKVTVFHY
uniref:Dirigent protein n=1 Tax=Davidia involucrata TaxID=16924 RepID=A0A5B7BU92_DAVIN